MRFAFIDAERARHTVARLCSAMQVSRAGYHAWPTRAPSARSRSDAVLAERTAWSRNMWSRRIVGWSMRADLRADLVVDAISVAVARRRPRPGAFGRPLADSGILASMGRRGDACDNAACER